MSVCVCVCVCVREREMCVCVCGERERIGYYSTVKQCCYLRVLDRLLLLAVEK